MSRIQVACVHCGKSFQTVPSTGQKFCSRGCANAAKVGAPAWNKGEKVTKWCGTCGKDMQVVPCLADRKRYCSTDCKYEAKRVQKGAVHPLFKPKVALSCQWCGAEISAYPSRAANKTFCSRACTGAASTAKQGGRRSSIEVAVEIALSDAGIQFVPQERIGRYSVDFFLPELQTVLECDGDYWHGLPKVQKRDQVKDKFLVAQGFKVRRFREMDILKSAAELVATLRGS